MKYIKRLLWNSKWSDKKTLIKEVKQFHHKMLFRIPINMKEVESVAINPYFDIGYNCAWERLDDRIHRICANKVISKLLVEKK